MLICYCYREASKQLRIISVHKKIIQNRNNMRGIVMRDNYDFSDSIPNPYAKKLKKQITLRLDDGTIRYFEELAEKKVFLIKA